MGSLYSALAELDPLAILLMQEGEFEEAESLQEFHRMGAHVTRGAHYGEQASMDSMLIEFSKRIKES